MNLAAAPTRAESITGQKAAAKLYNDIDYELGMGDPSSDQEAEGELALSTLRRRFPGVEDAAHEIDQPPSLSRRGQEGLRDAGRPRVNTPHGGRRRQPSRPPRPTRPKPKPGQVNTSRVRDVGQRALDARVPTPSVPSPSLDFMGGAGGGQLFVQVLAWGMGLSLLYLVLSRPNAFTSLFGGVVSTAQAVVSPAIDPLNPRLSKAVVSAQAARAAGTARATAARASTPARTPITTSQFANF